MTQQVTRWKPDTCNCIVDMRWDSDLAVEDRTHELHEINTKCDAHAAIADDILLSELFGENQFKNKMINKAVALMNFTEQDIKDGKVDFNFDGNRKLSLLVKGITQNKITAIQTAIASDQNITAKDKQRLKNILNKA